ALQAGGRRFKSCSAHSPPILVRCRIPGRRRRSWRDAVSDHPRQEPVSSRRVMRGRVFSVRRDVVRLPDGRHVRREVVEHPGAVVVAPLLDDGRILFVRQYRYAAGRHLVELPAGTLEPGEDPAATAARELQEECGCRAGRLEPLGTFYSAPGFCTELLHAYAALDLVPAVAEPDPDED